MKNEYDKNHLKANIFILNKHLMLNSIL